MLKLRIMTALAMLAILLPAVFYPDPFVFSCVAAILVSVGSWEWARLNQLSGIAAWGSGWVCLLACGALWFYKPSLGVLGYVWLVSGAAWVLFSVWVLFRGSASWLALSRWVRLVGGLIALIVAWLAVSEARARGLDFLFSALVLVWGADIFAYFVGRAFGGRFFKRRLAPSISPGKTWEGVFGGAFGVLVIAMIWVSLDSKVGAVSTSLFSFLHSRGSGTLVLGVAFLVAMSVIGDLVESLFKRSAGVKDSSGLLPGHGGVLDRIDALLPVLPLAMMLATV